MGHVFISDGRLYLREADGRLREIESHFVKEKMQRDEKQRSADSWKSESMKENAFSSFNLWGNQTSGKAAVPFRFKNVIPAEGNSIYYVMTNNLVTGLFKYSLEDEDELRLFHKNDFVEQGMDFSEEKRQFVVAVQEEDGRVNLKLLDEEGKIQETLTDGDSRDAYPRFSRANAKVVHFQSAGIGRDDEGFVWAYGPEAIIRLDMETNVLGETVDMAKMQKAARSMGELSLVPRSWELICLRTDGEIRPIARKVSSFDIDREGNLHYTNGFKVQRESRHETSRVFSHDIIEHLRLVQVH